MARIAVDHNSNLLSKPRGGGSGVPRLPASRILHVELQFQQGHGTAGSPSRRQAALIIMSSQASPRPTPAPASNSSGGVALPIPLEERQQYFDNSIWYTLSLWPALTVAVQNSFGGPDSSDKRDWFAGAISTLFDSNPATDHDDLVVFLLQVMQDEFEVMVEDDSEEAVAGEIVGMRKKVFEEGERAVYEGLRRRWESRGKMKIELVDEGEEEGEWSDEDEDGDVEMGEAPELVPTASKEKKEKPLPEIDEEGFEKVVSKKKR